jgi:hypothetical protein
LWSGYSYALESPSPGADSRHLSRWCQALVPGLGSHAQWVAPTHLGSGGWLGVGDTEHMQHWGLLSGIAPPVKQKLPAGVGQEPTANCGTNNTPSLPPPGRAGLYRAAAWMAELLPGLQQCRRTSHLITESPRVSSNLGTRPLSFLSRVTLWGCGRAGIHDLDARGLLSPQGTWLSVHRA